MKKDVNKVTPMKELVYEPNSFKRFMQNFKINIRNYFRNFKFPLGTTIFFGVILIFAAVLFLLIRRNIVEVPERPTYDKTGFIEASSGELKDKDIVLENDRYEFHFDETNTHFYLLDKLTNKIWNSNVSTEDNFNGITNSVKNKQKNTLIAYYHDKNGNANPLENYELSISSDQYAVRYDENSIEVLYSIGDLSIKYTDFPQRIGKERYENLILNKITERRSKELIESAYSFVTEHQVYVLKNSDSFADTFIKRLYKIIFEEAGYTKEDLEYDNKVNNVKVEDIRPYIEISVKYQLTDDGFHVKLINESIFEKENYPLIYVDLLPYFGEASVLNDGYIFLPDGSGTLMHLNNGKTYALPYEKRIYGTDYGKEILKKPEANQPINLPVFGLKKDDGAFLGIVTQGASMASILADVSEKYDSYNKVYTRFYYRESDKIRIITSKEYVLDRWTKYYSTSDYEVEYKFTNTEEATYVGMAKLYRNFLENKGLTQVDETVEPVMNLTLLGGYQVTKHFLGIPYNSVSSLTSTDNTKYLIKELKTDDINNLNIIYKGFINSGLKPYSVKNLDFEKVIGSKKDFNELFDYANKNHVKIYPEIPILTVYTDKYFNSSKEAARYLSGDVVTNYDYNRATLLPDINTKPAYSLNPNEYLEYLDEFLDEYEKLDTKHIMLEDYASIVNGTYKNQNFYFRYETLEKQMEGFDLLEKNLEHMMLKNPIAEGLFYSDSIIDLPVLGTSYYIVDEYIPFYQLVLSGKLDYAGAAFNIDDSYTLDWHKLKAIETGSNLNFTWSYEDTYPLINTEYNIYYSTYYKNWYDDAINMYNELNDLGIYQSSLVNHEILAKDVVKVTYSGGKEIVINYGVTTYDYNGTVIASNNYVVVREAN